MIHVSHRAEARRAFLAVAALAILLLLARVLPPPLQAQGLAGYLPLHTAIEVLSVAVAAMVFAIGWSTQLHQPSRNVLLLSCLFLGVALLDLSHLLSYQGMPAFVTPSGPEKAIDFWLAARSLAAGGMLAVAILPWTERAPWPRAAMLGATLVPVALFHLLVLLRPDFLPSTFVPGQGLTAFKVGFEYVLICIYGLAALRFLSGLSRPRLYNASGLMAAAAIMAMGEYFFTLYASVTDVYNLLGHAYKAVAYAFLYRAIFVETVQQPHLRLAASERQLGATLNALPDLLFEVSAEGRYIAVHAGATGGLAAPASALVGRLIVDVLPAAAARTCLQVLEDTLAHGTSRGRRIMLKTPDGWRHFELSAARRDDGPGKSPNVLLISRDVTEVVAQELALAHEAHLNAILLALPQQAEGLDEPGFLRLAASRAASLTDSRDACLLFVRAGCEVLPPPGGVDTPLADAADAWAAVLEQRQAVTLEVCLPPGLKRLLALPAIEDGQVKMLLGVADKAEPYAERDRQTLQILTDAIWRILSRQRQDATVRRLSSAVAQSPFPIIITGLDARIEYVNAAFTALSGYSEAESLGRNPRFLQSGKTPPSSYKDLWARLKQGEAWTGELINRRKDGSEYTEQALIYPVRNEAGQVVNYLAHKENITAQKAATDRIRQLSYFDQLTGLPNRSLLVERLRHALDLARHRGEPLTLMWLDLDRFKAVNDSLGRATGDQLLCEVSRRLLALVQDPCTVSRPAGDDFAIVLPGVNQHEAAARAAGILGALELPVALDEQEQFITASIGIAHFPTDGDDPEALLRCAEAAMHLAKEDGRSAVRFYASGMQEQAARALGLSNSLKQALARGELRLAYQPQGSLVDGRIVGVEALLRWRSPIWGDVSPAEFVPLAESTGLIVPIGEWVLRTAVGQLRQWQEQGLTGLTMAVNLSAVQFVQPGLAAGIERLVREIGVDPELVELELTEAVTFKNPEAAIAVMQELNNVGFRLAIDDFGTGYSSLNYLKRLAVHKLKIDRSFVRELDASAHDQAIVSAIIQMGHSLGLHIIAEGVETHEQLAMLRARGCDEIQGYLLGRPTDPAQFAERAHDASVLQAEPGSLIA